MKDSELDSRALAEFTMLKMRNPGAFDDADYLLWQVAFAAGAAYGISVARKVYEEEPQ